jgi:hypothetical protein
VCGYEKGVSVLFALKKGTQLFSSFKKPRKRRLEKSCVPFFKATGQKKNADPFLRSVP